MENQNNTRESDTRNDASPKVTGIGGIFFYSENPQEARAWYAKNLGIEAGE